MKQKILTLSLALLVIACGPSAPSKNPSPLQESEKIVLLDVPLRNLNIVKHRAVKTDSGQLMVQIEMENEKNKDIWTDIQIVFKNESGVEIERTSWEPFMFHRRSVSNYQKVSMKSDATDYRILIRNEK